MTENPIGKVFAYLVLIIAMAIMPVILLLNNYDITQRSYVDEVCQTFTEECRSTGYVSKSTYDMMISNLSTTNKTYTIKMLHKSKISVPNDDNSAGYSTSYTSYNQDDILNVLEDGQDYVMKNGDYFTLSIVSQQPMTGSSFMGILSGYGPDTGMSIVCTSGGMVGNTQR